jgi:internalin A
MRMLICLLLIGSTVVAQAPKPEIPKPLPEAVVEEWTRAGFIVGGENIGTLGLPEWQMEPKAGAIPGFRLLDWRPGLMATLPAPETHFSLDFTRTGVTDDWLKELAKLKKLTSLDLRETQVTNAGLKELATLEFLTSLNLSGTKVTDEGLRQLAPLRNLNCVILSRNTDTTLEIMSEIGLLHALSLALTADGKRPTKPDEVTSFELTSSDVTDAGLKELAKLKNLTTLHLAGTEFTDDWLKELAKFKDLTALDLSGTKVTDAGLKELATLNNLTALDVSETRITNAGLNELSMLKNLKRLYLSETQITDAGLKGLSML